MPPKKAEPTESAAEPIEAEHMPPLAHTTLPALAQPAQDRAMVLMPATSIETAVERYTALVGFVQKLMKPDIDFGVIPGTNAKPVLLKPGGEKLCMFFGLRPEFLLIDTVKDWDRGIFYFEYKCILYRGDYKAGEGVGSCNSREKKYRYRNSERVCPGCGKATIIKGKDEFGGGWLCFSKKGGCGLKFHERAPEIVDQEVGQVENPEPFELINTIQKMGQKRAFMAAVIMTVNASEFFTQDLEDFDHTPEPHREPAPAPQNPATPSAAPKAPNPPASGPSPAQRPAARPTGQAEGAGVNNAKFFEDTGVVDFGKQGQYGWSIRLNGVYMDIASKDGDYWDMAMESKNTGTPVKCRYQPKKNPKYFELVKMRWTDAVQPTVAPEDDPRNYPSENELAASPA